MPSEVTIFSSNKLDTSGVNFAKLSTFLGVDSKLAHLNSITNVHDLHNYISSNNPCVVMSSQTLAKMLEIYDNDKLSRFLFKKTAFILVHSLWPSRNASLVMKYLSDNSISSLSYLDDVSYEYEVSRNHKEITRELSGVSFGPINNKIDFTLNIDASSKDILPIISINRHPFFLGIRKGACTIFLAACKGIIDIDKKLPKPHNIKPYFSEIVPSMLFLKYIFKDSCWHNEKTFANFIIDDPLLKERYGFLNYRLLLKIMDQYNFSSTIAFIPWNFKKTTKSISNLFRARGDKLNICVHGCNHTKAEFGTSDFTELNSLVKLATERMEAHQQKNRLAFDKVMVFPQGIFSREAMKALKYNNFLAAVNSTASPIYTQDEGLTISDYLDVAITKYGNFPLFIRKYPNDAVESALHAFLGKPLLFVEHHGYFRNGYRNIVNFVKKMNSISQGICWGRLEDILRKTYLVKASLDNSIYCKIYTNEVLIENNHQTVRKYVITKSETGDVPIKSVLVNGKTYPYKIGNNYLNITLEVGAKAFVNIKVIYEDSSSLVSKKMNLVDVGKVYLRRYMSERLMCMGRERIRR